MEFEWSARKAERNLLKHGISFETAAQIFRGPTVEAIDDREYYGELRWQALGHVEGTVLLVVYSEPNDRTIRIISAWKAGRDDARRYYQAIFG